MSASLNLYIYNVLDHARVYIFIQLMYNKNDHLAKRYIFIRCLILLWLVQPLPPPDPRRPLYILYMFIATYHCQKGILGLGGKASKNKLKDTNFAFPMENVIIFSIFRTNAQKNNRKVLEMKATSIINILALSPFEN